MRRFYLAAGGLGLSVAVSIAMANPPVLPGTDPAVETAAAFDPSTAQPPQTQPPQTQPVEPKAADPEAVLREEYLKLMHEKAALMDQAALEAALSTAQQDIRELEAQNLLDEAKAILARVADEYAKTGAAEEATFMLQRQNARPAQPANGSFKPL